MQKTPVSILQEMAVKKSTIPTYNLTYDGGGTHDNTFIYKVDFDGLSAEGKGRCKKDAKHAAATNLLKAIADRNGLLQLPATPADSPVRTPLPKPMPTPHVLPPEESFVNAIGVLQDLCAENELGEVVYETVNDIGPPHARVFTIQCFVSSFKEEGIATTKKQAKHEAARKMHARIKKLVDNGEYVPTRMLEDQTENLNSIDIIDVLSKYTNAIPFHRKANLGIKLPDYHRKMVMAYDAELREEMIAKLRIFKRDLSEFATSVWVEEFCEVQSKKFEEILSPMNVEAHKMIFRNDENQLIMVALHLNTTPEILELHSGIDDRFSFQVVYLRVIDNLILLLS